MDCKHKLKKHGLGFICVKCHKFFKEDISKTAKEKKEEKK